MRTSLGRIVADKVAPSSVSLQRSVALVFGSIQDVAATEVGKFVTRAGNAGNDAVSCALDQLQPALSSLSTLLLACVPSLPSDLV